MTDIIMTYRESTMKEAQEAVKRVDEMLAKEPPLRPVLAEFAALMEAKLRKNDHKTSWRQLPIEALFRLLMVEIEEFKIAHEFLGKDEARNELIDVADFCLILHDRLGMEK